MENGFNTSNFQYLNSYNFRSGEIIRLSRAAVVPNYDGIICLPIVNELECIIRNFFKKLKTNVEFSTINKLYRRLSVRTTYFGETFKNNTFQRCVEERHISAKRSKTTYFDEALKYYIFHRSFFSCNFVVVALHHLKINYMGCV